MLRGLLFLLAVAACLGGAVAVLAGHPEGTPWAAWGGVVAAAVVLERWRYGRRTEGLGADWQPTAERFVDPESGRTMQVFFNPRTGERRYEPVPTDRHDAP